MSTMIVNDVDEKSGVFRYNLNGYRETISINIKINPETYGAEGSIFSVIGKGIDTKMFGMENIADKGNSFIVKPILFDGDKSIELCLAEVLKYLHINRDSYMNYASKEISDVIINDLLYINSVEEKRREEKKLGKENDGVLASIKNMFRGK